MANFLFQIRELFQWRVRNFIDSIQFIMTKNLKTQEADNPLKMRSDQLAWTKFLALSLC